MDAGIFIKQLIVGPLAVCCYLVAHPETRETAIIDPGGDEDLIIDTLKKDALRPVIIINTHAHPDHTAGNKVLKEALNVPIAIHELDAGDFLTQAHLFLGRIMKVSPVPPDKLLKDRDQVALGSLSLKIIHTPGHTPGSICLYYPGHVFTGDTLFVRAVGRTDLPGGSWETLIKSIKTRLFTLPEETIVWPGHDYGEKPHSTIGEEKKLNPFIK